MITDDNIADALWAVDEETVETTLAERDCFLYGLAKAVVYMACTKEPDARNLQLALNTCIKEAKSIQRDMATKVAQDKDNAHRFQCEMKDDDWDDMKMRMTA